MKMRQVENIIPYTTPEGEKCYVNLTFVCNIIPLDFGGDIIGAQLDLVNGKTVFAVQHPTYFFWQP
jgi:hypothetical protein